MFNEQEYANANPDLPGSWTDEQFQYHFNAFGFAEGRDVYWRAADYVSLNTDLAGMTDDEAFSHWVTFGKGESRVPWFQADGYRDANGDLAGMTDAEALSHWVEYGMDEGRIQGFDCAGYLELNDDVPQGWTFAEALNHYYQYGQDEGRAFDAYVDEPEGTIVPVVDGNVTTLALDTDGGAVTLTADNLVVDGGVGTQTLRLTGDASARIDLTDPADQVEGLDLNGNGLIASDGIENNLSNAGIMTVSNFEVFDAYARNPINETDHDANYFGDIGFDGTGFAGDGVNTDGNIYLGGLGVDTAFGGIGNDFMAGGGVAAGRFTLTGALDGAGRPIFMDNLTGLETVAPGVDTLYGGRNADFFYVELSALDPTDGNGTQIDGGATWDNDASQDSDWVLLEASDDNEPAVVNLGGNIFLPDGTNAAIGDIEHLDASGDLYSFLNSFDAVLGGMRDYKDAHEADGTENSGLGSTGQLIVNGDGNANIVVGGYDNDTIAGAVGDDILFGGKLSYLLAYANNPNLLDANEGLDLNVTSVGTVNDGRDTLRGGADDDAIIFEMDGGEYEGGAAGGVTGVPALTADNDILFVTDFSMGRMQGHTAADELSQGVQQAQADALAALTTDSTVRIDLGVGQGVFYRGYGGADTLNNETTGLNFSADQTNYQTGIDQSTVQDIDGVIATGLGALDYDADGENVSDLSARYQANFRGINADMDLRGIDLADVSGNFGYFADASLDLTHNAGDDTLYANTGDDILEGRAGNDLLSGGRGHDDFIFNLNAGDDVDIVHRQVDDDSDGLWDDADGDGLGDFAQDYRVTGDGISADPSIVTFCVNNPDDIIAVLFTLDGNPLTADGAGIIAATTMEEIATEVNAQLSAIDANLSAVEDAGDLVITDASGRAFTGTSIAGDLGAADFVASAVIDNGTPAQSMDEIDRVIFKSYAARATNLGTDDQQVTLGANAYAQDLVVGFEEDAGNVSTTLVNGQQYDIQFQNLNEGDVVTVNINGVDYTRTVAVGENTDVFVANFTAQINNQTWDLSTTSGQLAAAKADVFTIVGGATAAQVAAEAVLQITEVGGLVYMATPEVTITNPNGTPGTARIADVSASSVELLDYDGRNNDINEDTVLFVGNTGAADNYGRSDADPTDISAGSDYSWSVLATALTDGGTLTGKDAILVDLLLNDGVNDTALHGDDLLIGAAGDDVINAGTGDDTIVGSAGADTVDGGGNDAGMVGGVYADTLVFNEDVFGAGTMFDIAVGGIGFANDGTVTVSGTGTGVTTYTGIELVRTYSDTATDTLDFSTLSDEIAATTTVGATQVLRDMWANEGVTFNFNPAVGMTYTVDRDNDDIVDAGEVNIAGSRVLGIENIIGGGANDTVVVEETQIGSTNNINLAGNANNEGALTVGQDTVQYFHNNPVPGWAAAQRPDVTIGVSTANTIVTFDNGILGATTSSDTLVNVEVLDITNAAISNRNADVINVSSLTDAIVNYGGALAVLDSLQANGNAVDNTAALLDLTLIDAGGIAQAGVGQGAEVITITGVTNMERVTGGAGDDRVVVADNMQDNTVVAVATPDLGFWSYLGDGEGPTPAPNDALVFADAATNGLYQFDLGVGTGDMLDYTNETGDVAVVLATDDTTADRVLIDGDADGDLTNDVIGDGDRVDLATNVGRYFGGAGWNIIDLGESTVATTIDFSEEVTLNGTPSPMDHGNEFIDPDGFNGANDTDMLGIEVRGTADSTVYGRFMDDPNTTGNLWTEVSGNAQAQTVLLTDNETGQFHNFGLMGGANTVDYSALTAGTGLFFWDTNDGGVLRPTFDAANNKLESLFWAGVAVEDDITIWRDANSGNGTLTVIGSNETTDEIDISGFAAVAVNGQHVVNLTTQQVIEDETNTNPVNGNFTTNVQGFENVTGSAFADHITGNGQDNTLTGGLGDDIIRGMGGADGIDTGVGADRVGYAANSDGNVADAVTTADADAINVWTTGTDFIEFSGVLQAGLEHNGTVHTGVAGTFDLNLDGIFISNTPVATNYDADSVTLANVAGAVGALINDTADDEAIFLITDVNNDVGIYYWQSDGSGAVDAADTLTLLGVEYTGAGVAALDIITRIASAANGQNISLGASLGALPPPLSAAEGVHEIVYTNQNQSVLASRDVIDEYDATKDFVDLSALGLELAATDTGYNDLNANNIDDAIELIITETPVSVDNTSPLPNFFLDTMGDLNLDLVPDNVDRAVVVQQEPVSDSYRVFVDVNRDGDFNQADDIVFDIMNEGGDDGAPGISGNDLVAFTAADFIFA